MDNECREYISFADWIVKVEEALERVLGKPAVRMVIGEEER